jgi:hypothetical protein
VAQLTALAPAQTPAWQLSLCVHALASSHVVPSRRIGLVQAPIAMSQVPAVWQASDAVQTTAVPAQTPDLQLSFWVQPLLSLQVVPSAATGSLH